jgi:membrane protein YdbS with pleckstrin-like domain
MEALTLHRDEKIKDIYHESGIVQGKPFAGWIAVLLIVLYPILFYGLWDEYGRIIIVVLVVLLALILRQAFIWRLNRYIITNERLIKIAHTGVFKRLVIETPLERILNVSFKTTGFLSSLFRFGDVEVQVVGLMEPVVLKNISQPGHVKDYLWKLHLARASGPPHLEGTRTEKLQEEIGYTKHNQRIL